MKRLVYFLLACNAKQTIRFLHKYRPSFEENKGFSKNFIRYSKVFFKHNKRYTCLSERDLFLVWRKFCKKHSYEEVFPFLLCYILQYPKEKVSWILKIQPETLSWRLNQALSALEKEWFEVEKEGNMDDRERFFSTRGEAINTLLKTGKSKILIYCEWLAKQPLPMEVEQLTFYSNEKKIKKGLLIFLCFIVLIIAIWLLSFILSQPAKVILYPVGYDFSIVSVPFLPG